MLRIVSNHRLPNREENQTGMTDAPGPRKTLTKLPDITYRRTSENLVWHF